MQLDDICLESNKIRFNSILIGSVIVLLRRHRNDNGNVWDGATMIQIEKIFKNPLKSLGEHKLFNWIFFICWACGLFWKPMKSSYGLHFLLQLSRAEEMKRMGREREMEEKYATAYTQTSTAQQYIRWEIIFEFTFNMLFDAVPLCRSLCCKLIFTTRNGQKHVCYIHCWFFNSFVFLMAEVNTIYSFIFLIDFARSKTTSDCLIF